MKIIQVLNHFLPDHVAGTEVYTYSLCKNLEKSAFEAVVVIPNYSKTINEEYFYDGLRVIKYAEPSVVDRQLQMSNRKPDGLSNFIEILKKEQSDVVHFHELAGSNGITLHHVLAAKELGFEIIMTFHVVQNTSISNNPDASVDIFDIKQGSLNFYHQKGFSHVKANLTFQLADLFRKLNLDVTKLGKMGTALSVPQLVEKKRNDFLKLQEASDRFIVIAHWYQRALLDAGVNENKLTFIEQGIFANPGLPIKKLNQDKGLKIIFVGRISHFKGVKMLIDVIGKMDGNEVILDIYGDSGEDKNYMTECYEMAEDIPHIKFKGKLPPDKVIEKMSEYDLLVHPSTITEMSPLVIREAFAAGIPVLSSNNKGSEEQIKDGLNGWLFKMNNTEDLSNKLRMLIDHPELLKEASKHIPVVRTFKDVALEYEKVYNEIATKNSKN